MEFAINPSKTVVYIMLFGCIIFWGMNMTSEFNMLPFLVEFHLVLVPSSMWPYR